MFGRYLTRSDLYGALLILALWPIGCPETSAANAETARVPTFVCPASDETETERREIAESMSAPVEQPLAGQLAYYKAPLSPGVFAPRNWYCRAWAGSNGTVLLVEPKAISPPYFPLPTITGPAVLLQTFDQGATGRFHVAIVAARLFPLLGDELIARVRQEHVISDASFAAEPYAEDQLQYLSDRLVEYSTPPNRTGLGTDSIFEASDLPIRGLATLNPKSDVSTLTEFRLRLPVASNAIAAAILQLETTCLQLQQGCRGLR